jgi:uncharacterized iron-regulated membrane protein
VTAKSIRNWYLVHKWTSLISTLFLLMLCITGLPLIFAHEIDHALGNSVEPPELSGSAATATASADDIVASALARRPQDVVQYLYREADEPELWYVGMAETADAVVGSAFYTFDARSGEFLHEYPLNQGFIYLMYRLHLDMFAGLGGTLFLGLMGLLLAASLVSGAVVYGPFMSKLKFGTVRRDRSPRLKWLDLHNLLGIATLMWVMVVGVTGVINTLALPIFGQWQATELAAMTADYRDEEAVDAGAVSVDRVLRTAQKAAPEMEVNFVAFPGNPFASPNHFGVFMTGNTPLTAKLMTPVLVEAASAELTAVGEMPWYVTSLLISRPLHFGDYGGLPLKILWALLDIIAIVVLGSGVYLWVKKRNLSIEERFAGLRRGAALPQEAA